MVAAVVVVGGVAAVAMVAVAMAVAKRALSASTGRADVATVGRTASLPTPNPLAAGEGAAVGEDVAAVAAAGAVAVAGDASTQHR